MIYLIDDDISIRRGFDLFLKSASLNLTSFERAEDFLSSVKKPESHDLLILDIHLPEMSGCDLLQKLNQENISIPVIVVTAFDDVQSREACRSYGVKAYLRKPVDGEALIDIIKYNLTS
jgi:FixJ family two-component response regulator